MHAVKDMHHLVIFSLFSHLIINLLLLLIITSNSLITSHALPSHNTRDSCEPFCCKEGGPEIRFPFTIKDNSDDNNRSGYPGFDLSCKGNDVFLRLPFLNHVDLIVEDIDYKQQTLVIADPNDCLVGLLLNSSTTTTSTDTILSASPFRYYEPSNYTFLTCSKNTTNSPISCLGDSTHDVIIMRSSSYLGGVPVSCRPVKTVVISYSLFVYYDYPRQLLLRWYLPGCDDHCEQGGGKCAFKSPNSNDAACFPNHEGPWKKCEITGAIIGPILLIVVVVISTKAYRSWKLNKKLDSENEIMVEKFLEEYKSLNPTRYSYSDLIKITNQFKEKLGQGGFGCVFKGSLPNGTLVAVKILLNFSGDGKEFMNEVGTMGRIHHVNVVRLLGFCTDRLKRALLYEYMPNESLEKFIFSRNNHHQFLGWEKLQDIAMGIARGIEYLHQGCDQRILHFDIKPHNILLDESLNPKISDFGLAKLCSKGQSMVSMTMARGTKGYIAPEVYSRNFGNVSYKSDVYSFGMMLLEMVRGRKNNDVIIDTHDAASEVYFPEWIYKRLYEGEEIGMNILTGGDAKIARKLTIVALWCIQWQPTDRPSMKSVIQMLEGSTEGLVIPPDPFGSATGLADPNGGKCETTSLSTIFE